MQKRWLPEDGHGSVLRNNGVTAYGFSGQVNTPEVTAGVHGNNERLSLESFRQSLSMVFEVTRRMCVRTDS